LLPFFPTDGTVLSFIVVQVLRSFLTELLTESFLTESFLTKQESNFVLLYVGTIGGGKRYNIAALIHCLRLSNFDKHTVYTSDDCGSLLTNLVLKMRLIF
jgi:signal recognition particle GTPase